MNPIIEAMAHALAVWKWPGLELTELELWVARRMAEHLYADAIGAISNEQLAEVFNAATWRHNYPAHMIHTGAMRDALKDLAKQDNMEGEE